MTSIIKKYSGNPVLSAADIKYPSSLVFNAGICKFQGKYVMVFRNDVGYSPNGRTEKPYTNLGVAFSDDGINWEAQGKPWDLPGRILASDPEYVRFYDPRLTVIDNRCYLCFAIDTKHGICGGIAVTDDFENFEILSISTPDNRNMVLFPEKINGEFFRLERPFPTYSCGGEFFDIWCGASPDCRYWGKHKLVLGNEKVPFANQKIGPGAPPVKTEAGWLTLFHAVKRHENKVLNGWEQVDDPRFSWVKEYSAGIMLLDLNDPSKVIGMASEPLICAEKDYELDGFRGSVIFPGGMILEDSGEVKIYYGAADTVECLATADVNELIRFCGK